MSSADDLDMSRSGHGAASKAGSTRRPSPPPGERISFYSDSEEKTADEAPKKKKAKTTAAASKPSSRRRTATTTITTNTATTTKKTSSLVGRRKLTGRKAKNIFDEDDDEETAGLETTLPGYLQQWRREAREQRAGEECIRLPPKYDDIPLPKVGRDEEEKPHLPGIAPPRPHTPHHLCDNGIIPASISAFLKQYQVDGTEWLYRRFVRQEGGLLGDDMGLGKTIQVIAFLTAAFGKTGDSRDHYRMRAVRKQEDGRFYPRVLIVCPGGLMANWREELERWGWWHVHSYHDKEKADALKSAHSGRLEIMITTYDTYKRDQDSINMIRWDVVIADEVHQIKDRKSQNAQAMNNVNALCRIGLSGTSIQNKYEELWTLLNWCNPGCVGSIASWKRCICVPLKMGQSHDASYSQLAKARRTAERLKDNLLPRFFLRRTKALIAHQLPKKSDRVVFCPMTETQIEAYQNFTDTELVRTIRDASNPCTCGSKKKAGWCCNQEVEGFGDWKLHIFPVLITLQKLCNHIALMLPHGENDRERHEKDILKLKMALPDQWEDLYKHRDNIKNLSKPEFCGKYRVLKKLLKLWYDNGDKVLIFSHSVRLLKMLDLLLKFNTDYNMTFLDGTMKYEVRKAAVDEFNANPNQFAFLISTKAGGVGLNITSANKVVVVDPNWNPAWDLQAQDRAYRIGQTRDVEVFRLVSSGTVEEIVYARQIYKQQQANIGYNASVERRYFKGVQDQKDQKGEIFGLTNLFAPQKANVVLRDIVNKTNIAETKAGVDIVGLDLEASQEDDDDLPLDTTENADISQLAADILGDDNQKRKHAGQAAKKKDPVQAILASAGVEYTHENAEVIGTSKIETKLSSRAQKAENDVDYVNELAFAKSQSQQQPAPPSHGFVYPQHRQDAAEQDDAAIDLNDGLGKIRYKFKPSEDVQKRQFCSMAKHFGYEDVTEFALIVEGWTQEQRRDCLEKFYKDRRAEIAAGR